MQLSQFSNARCPQAAAQPQLAAGSSVAAARALGAGRAHQSGRLVARQQAQQSRKLSQVVRFAAESAPAQQSKVQPVQQGHWHAVVANAEFMLHDVQNEAFAEQLRERRRLYKDKSKPLDFWLVAEPAWLDARFPAEAKKIRRPCVALVSTDEIWINFMKLRLDRVLRLDLGEQALADVLKSNGALPKYEPLDKAVKWTAPYPPYRPGWWEVFMQQ